MSELIVASNHLEACQSWQEVINAQATTREKDAAGRQALTSLRNGTFLGTRKLIVSGEAAMFLPDGVDTLEEAFSPVVQFGQVIAEGWLGRLSYIGLKRERFLDWALYEPRVLGPVEENFVSPNDEGSTGRNPLHELPIDRTLTRPLHFPVGLINYAACYG